MYLGVRSAYGRRGSARHWPSCWNVARTSIIVIVDTNPIAAAATTAATTASTPTSGGVAIIVVPVTVTDLAIIAGSRCCRDPRSRQRERHVQTATCCTASRKDVLSGGFREDTDSGT